MAGVKGKSGKAGSPNAGRKKNAESVKVVSLRLYPNTEAAIQELRARCKTGKTDFVKELNKRIAAAMVVEKQEVN